MNKQSQFGGVAHRAKRTQFRCRGLQRPGGAWYAPYKLGRFCETKPICSLGKRGASALWERSCDEWDTRGASEKQSQNTVAGSQ